jgi:hypothetical protein
MNAAPRALGPDEDDDILYEAGEYAEMHPALDVAQGSLYTALLVNTKRRGLVPYLLKSRGADTDHLCQIDKQPYDTWNPAGRTLKTQGLDLSYATPQLRWSGDGLRKALSGEPLEVPSFPAVYQAVYSKLAEYLVVSDERHLTLAALFVLLTYYHSLFDKLPILWAYALQGVGKSRLAEAVAYLAFNGMVTSTATRSTIFRSADAGRYTQALTEMDVLTGTRSGEALATDFHGCTNPGEAWVAVAEQPAGKGTYKPQRYYGYSPRILCTTAPIKSGPLLSRCVRLDILPTSNPDMDKLDKTLKPENADLAPVRDMLYRVQFGRWTEVQEAYRKAKATWRGADAPKGRPRDKWLPLMALATLSADPAAIQTVKELAAKDAQEFLKSRADSLDAYLIQFAWHVALSDREETGLTRAQVWTSFTAPAQDRGESFPRKEAAWAEQFGLSLDIDWLKRGKAGGPQKLVDELKRLGLVAGRKETKDNTYYVFDREQVLNRIRDSLGPEMAQACADMPHLDKHGCMVNGAPSEDEPCIHLNHTGTGKCPDCGAQIESPTEAQRRMLRVLGWPDEETVQMPRRTWKAILDNRERCPEDIDARELAFSQKKAS